MTVRTREQLETAANEIRDETAQAGNTPARVGGFCRDVVDSMPLASEVPTPAPADAAYLVSTASSGLSAERVCTDTATIAWDFTTGGQAKANVPDGSLGLAKFASIAAGLLGRASGTGAPVLLSSAQSTALLDVFTTSVNGLVPASPGGTSAFMRADGSWATPSYPSTPSLSSVLAVDNDTGAHDLEIAAAQVIALIAGTPSTAGPANALLEFKREGGGTSSFIGVRTSGGLRFEGQDGVTIVAVAATSHVSISSGSSASVGISSGSAGTTISSTGGKVTVQDLRLLQFDALSDEGNSGTAKTIVWSLAGNSPSALQKVTLNNNVTFTFTNPEMPTYPLMLELHQDATGGRDCTFPGSVKDAAGLSAALLQTASTFAQVVFLWNGSFYTWQIVANGLTP